MKKDYDGKCMHVVTNGADGKMSTGGDTDYTGVNFMSQTKRTGRMIKSSAGNASVAGFKKNSEEEKRDKRQA